MVFHSSCVINLESLREFTIIFFRYLIDIKNSIILWEKLKKKIKINKRLKEEAKLT